MNKPTVRPERRPERMFSVPRLSARLCLGLALVVCMAAVILTGCDANPSGSSSSGSSTTTTPTPPATVTAGTATIFGYIVGSNNTAIDTTKSTVLVDAYLGKDRVAQNIPLVGNTFTISGLAANIYVLHVRDTANPAMYSPTFVPVTTSLNAVTQTTITLAEVPTNVAASRLTLFGTYITPNKEPIQYAKVSLGGYQTITLADGRFFLYNIS
ncbi:MAG TPA: hypothetical protein PLP29_18550, partial [Candidatus Ozemobacteraceae bacterium]|nr:hypothetical protein [Candidatus Ozemobacteraceae bacterium]